MTGVIGRIYTLVMSWALSHIFFFSFFLFFPLLFPRQRVGTFDGHKGAVNSLAVNYDTTRLITGASDSTSILWDALTGKELFKFHHEGEPYYLIEREEAREMPSLCYER